MADGRAVQKSGQTAYAGVMAIPHIHDPRFNAAEFERIARAGGFGDARLELREGRIVKLSPQNYPHGRAKTELYEALKGPLKTACATFGIMPEVSVGFEAYFQPMPDIVVWDRAALDVEPTGPLPGHAVRLVVEVADSSLADDLGDKLASYARVGVPEYWVADVGKQRLFLHANADGDTYERRETYPFGDKVSALTLPLTLDTAGLIRA